MEYADLYYADRSKSGKTWARKGENKELFPKDLYRVIVHICIFNSKGELLIQQRQDHKSWGGRWDFSAAGSVLAGETSRQGAIRETLEELGVDVSNDLPKTPTFTHNFSEGFDDYFLTRKDIILSQITLQELEVKAVKWVTLEQLLEMIESEEFIPYTPHFVRLLFHFIDKNKIWTKW